MGAEINRSEPGNVTVFIADHDRKIVGKMFMVGETEMINEFVANYNDNDMDFILYTVNPNFKL